MWWSAVTFKFVMIRHSIEQNRCCHTLALIVMTTGTRLSSVRHLQRSRRGSSGSKPCSRISVSFASAADCNAETTASVPSLRIRLTNISNDKQHIITCHTCMCLLVRTTTNTFLATRHRTKAQALFACIHMIIPAFGVHNRQAKLVFYF